MFGSKVLESYEGVLLLLRSCGLPPSHCRAGADKVTIRHIPPGGPANYQQITVAPAAVPAHLAHGDFILTTGSCATD